MKKIWALLSAFVLGLSLISVPANASPATETTPANGFAMGGYPNYWTICVANGYGPTAGVITHWNWAGRRLAVHVQNRCDGYSITNRMTIDSENAPGAALGCISYTNTHKTYSPARGKYIWDQNPIVWINTAPECFQNATQIYHNIQRGVGYVLGIDMNPNTCGCVQGYGLTDQTTVPYVMNQDSLDAATIYGYL